MSSDSGDGVVQPRNKTVLRPQPGGRGPARGPMGVSPPQAGAASAATGAAAAGAAATGAAVTGAAAPAVADFVASGANPLLAAAGPLLTLGASVGAMVYQADVEGLRRQAIEAIRAFESQAHAAGVAADGVTIARYVLCTFLDSAILQTPWGGQTVWGPRSLLLLFHQEAQGGEKFFQILDRLRQDPARYVDLIELQYVCLALGFQGKYRDEPGGRSALQALQDDSYRLIRARRAGLGAALSVHWQGLTQPTVRAWRLLPWWVVGLAGLVVVLGALIAFRAKLSDQAAPIIAALAARGVETGYPAPAALQPSGRLKQLLAPEERAGEVAVEESGKRTLITLQIPDLFRSGSAQVAPGHAVLFAAIGRALQAVPGRILVVGHTDDQPVHSFRYADNFELSRARAIAVAQLLKPELTDFSRVEWTGLGDTDPRYRPPDTPENRARNRRVEILHVAE